MIYTPPHISQHSNLISQKVENKPNKEYDSKRDHCFSFFRDFMRSKEKIFERVKLAQSTLINVQNEHNPSLRESLIATCHKMLDQIIEDLPEIIAQGNKILSDCDQHLLIEQKKQLQKALEDLEKLKGKLKSQNNKQKIYATFEAIKKTLSELISSLKTIDFVDDNPNTDIYPAIPNPFGNWSRQGF